MPARRREFDLASIKAARPARDDAELMEAVKEWRSRPRGRPKTAHPKVRVTAYFDADAIERFKATGPGWQTRMSEALTKAASKLP